MVEKASFGSRGAHRPPATPRRATATGATSECSVPLREHSETAPVVIASTLCVKVCVTSTTRAQSGVGMKTANNTRFRQPHAQCYATKAYSRAAGPSSRARRKAAVKCCCCSTPTRPSARAEAKREHSALGGRSSSASNDDDDLGGGDGGGLATGGGGGGGAPSSSPPPPPSLPSHTHPLPPPHSSPHENLVFVYVHAAMRAASIRLSWAVEPRSWACVCVPSVEFCYWWPLMERGELVVDHHLQSMDYRHYYRKCGRDRLAHGSLGFGSN